MFTDDNHKLGNDENAMKKLIDILYCNMMKLSTNFEFNFL
jgi:hypothetical protein